MSEVEKVDPTKVMMMDQVYIPRERCDTRQVRG